MVPSVLNSFGLYSIEKLLEENAHGLSGFQSQGGVDSESFLYHERVAEANGPAEWSIVSFFERV